jgi:hypothetical protein
MDNMLMPTPLTGVHQHQNNISIPHGHVLMTEPTPFIIQITVLGQQIKNQHP